MSWPAVIGGQGKGWGPAWAKPWIGQSLEQLAVAAARRNNASLWYVKKDMSNVFQDSQGVTLAALNAPVGLLLDQQYGAANLGQTICTNGTFDSSVVGWGPTSGAAAISWQAGRLRVTRATSATFPACAQGQAVVAGKTYLMGVDVVANPNAVTVYCAVSGSTGFPTISGTGRMQFVWTANSSVASFDIGIHASSGAVGNFVEFDNATFQEVLGYAASQSTTAFKPTLVAGPTGYPLLRSAAGATSLDVVALKAAASGVFGLCLVSDILSNISPMGTDGAAPSAVNVGVKLRSDGSVWARAAGEAQSAPGVYAANVPFTAGATYGANQTALFVNGVQLQTSGGGFTGEGTFLRIFNGGVVTPENLPGKIGCVWFSRQSMPDADRRAIERFAASIVGAPYV